MKFFPSTALNALFALLVLELFAFETSRAQAEERHTIGVIASLSSFAANFGQAVVDGAQLAAAELATQGVHVDLKIEDDRSVNKETVSAYMRLAEAEHVDAIIGGSWWLNAVVKRAEQTKLPLLSCETLYNDDAVAGDSYFI